ncbi:ECF transporter S component [Bacillus toyonensis]|uniref:ECF transporter S component n=1 Tax=Bacillus toyonensis TaxID=155322 RepID=UPI000BECC9EC|nr:ECF transporter S component [Bacillus toyonensis]PED90003.1 ECF transporter S component [Bacillus toyonensis]PEK43070.1 ECF transporter S component [Bacillus toyonensis]PEL51691.1 ECF transporter S component [Bacillus toyonensis]PEN47015.1 ECF transporter S component [Bacillus toyonensis]PFZ33049.1 ECF transporter S component [Bacillus toyonensis]
MKLSKSFYNISFGNVKSVVIIALMASLTVVGRIMFAFIPNVQPVTTIIIIVTLVMGLKYGVVVSGLSIILSNLVLGIGLWTIPQIIGYTVIALLTGFVIRPLFERISHITLSIYAAFTGLLYGFIMSLWQAPIYGMKYFWVYYLAGLPFDMYHALGNFGFYFILAPILIPLLHKLLIRYYNIDNEIK